jgi:hypothetical protein
MSSRRLWACTTWSFYGRTSKASTIEVGGRIRSARVIEVLSRLISECGAPLDLRSD